jgi:hypothetical protein
MTVAPAISTISRPETAGIPYITDQEFLDAPTAVQTGDLVPGELAQLIVRASSWMDGICNQVLAATTDTEFCEVRSRFGSFSVYPRCFPIRAVTAVSVGWLPSSMAPLTTLANLAIQNRRFMVYNSALPTATMQGPIQFGPRGRDLLQWCQYSYINGYPVTVLATAVVAGASTLAVPNPTGILPGMILTLTDDPNSEVVTVASAYVFGSASVPLVNPTANAHAAGVPVSAMPPRLKQIAIEATAGMIAERGTNALMMATISGAPTAQRQSGSTSTGNAWLRRADEMLHRGHFVAKVSVEGDL